MADRVVHFMVDTERAECYITSIDEVKYGFWVDGYYDITNGEDAMYWIPPSKIIYVRKW